MESKALPHNSLQQPHSHQKNIIRYPRSLLSLLPQLRLYQH